MVHVFIGGIHTETNSFNPVPAKSETFTCQLLGEEIHTMRGTSLELGGVYDRLERETGITILPGFFAQACTCGTMIDADFRALCDTLFQSLKNYECVDAVLLSLHGAMQSELIDDCEGYILRGVRNIVGENVPVCVSLDFHAMISHEMMDCMDGACGYFTYPHVDNFETGVRAADCLLQLLKSGTKPYKLCRSIPLIMSCENSNTIDSPVVPAMNRIKALLEEEGVLSGSIFFTQPWLDTPGLGCSICLFFEDENKRAYMLAQIESILRYIWDSREEFYPPMLKIQEALAQVPAMKKPVMLVDYGDVPNAGSTGDGTVVLKALLDAKLKDSSVVVVADEQSTDQAVSVGVGNSATFMIGGFGEPGSYNARIAVEAKVISINTEPFVHLGPAQKGYIGRPGVRALLQCGNVYILLCRQVCFSHDRNIFLTMQLQPEEMGIIAMRATHTFMSCYKDILGSWMYVDTPGFSTRDLKSLPFAHCGRPIYPLDDIKEFTMTEVI